MQKPFIVGITGGSASGKTLFLQSLLAAFSPDEITLISQDNYYKNLEFIPKDENGVHNFDLPETIDHARFADHIHRLHERETVRTQEYTFNNPNVVPKELIYQPTPIIVVEGLFVFYFKDIYKQLDLKVFIASKNKVKLHRRIARDQLERDIALATILYQWEHHVRPTYQKYIKPYKSKADLVIPNNKHFKRGLEMMVGYLRQQIEQRRAGN
ncbi:MAG: uridine kinase [Sphingobacteriaceae bacterium]|nr:uridine kinase [Cytophagaceae bacterium]